MNKIILEADTKLEDKICREAVNKNFMNIQKINERTKIHTLDIRELRKLEKRITLLEERLEKYKNETK